VIRNLLVVVLRIIGVLTGDCVAGSSSAPRGDANALHCQNQSEADWLGVFTTYQSVNRVFPTRRLFTHTTLVGS